MTIPLYDRLFEPRFGWLAAGAALLSMLLLAVLSRAVIDHPVTYDELLHILAARGVLETGEPRIADGIYPRGELYTRLVALSYTLFGESAIAARIPALVFAVALVGLVVAWASMRAGVVAGLAAGVFLAILPVTVELAVFSRFYTLHALAVAIVAICAFEAARLARLGRLSTFRLAVVGTIMLSAALLAQHLQDTTLIAIGAVVAALVGLIAYDRFAVLAPFLKAHGVKVAGAAVLLIALLGALLWLTGLVDRFLSSAMWAADRAENWNYYNQRLGRSLPMLWPLFPLAAAAAVIRRRRLAMFCLLLFVVAFAAHSLAAQKAARYLYYAMPFMGVLLGIAFSWAVEGAQRALGAALPHRRQLALPAVLALALVVFGLSQEGQLTMRWLTARGSSLDALPGYANEADWSRALPELGEAAGAANHVVASAGVKALYHFGRYDYEINASVVRETETRSEFGLDRRTGRLVISEGESLAKVLAEAGGTTLVVVDDDKLGRANGVPDGAVRVLEERCVKMEMEKARLVHAWVCGGGEDRG